jgi:hypothetical protein
VAFVVSFIAAVVVPPTMLAVIVVSHQKGVLGNIGIVAVLEFCYSVEFLSKGPSNYLILFVLVHWVLMVKVKHVVFHVFLHLVSQLHVLRDGQDPLQREVGILDVSSVHFLVSVQ